VPSGVTDADTPGSLGAVRRGPRPRLPVPACAHTPLRIEPEDQKEPLLEGLLEGGLRRGAPSAGVGGRGVRLAGWGLLGACAPRMLHMCRRRLVTSGAV